MTSAQPRLTFWALTGSSAKSAVHLYFDPIYRIRAFFLKRRGREAQERQAHLEVWKAFLNAGPGAPFPPLLEHYRYQPSPLLQSLQFLNVPDVKSTLEAQRAYEQALERLKLGLEGLEHVRTDLESAEALKRLLLLHYEQLRQRQAKLHYEQLRQAKLAFNAALTIGVIGTCVLLAGIVSPFFYIGGGVSAIAAGIVLNTLSFFAIKFHREANQRLRRYESTIALVNQIVDVEKRDEAIGNLIKGLRVHTSAIAPDW